MIQLMKFVFTFDFEDIDYIHTFNTLEYESLYECLMDLIRLGCVIKGTETSIYSLKLMLNEPRKYLNDIWLLFAYSEIDFDKIEIDFEKYARLCKYPEMEDLCKRHLINTLKLELSIQNIENVLKDDFKWLDQENGLFMIKKRNNIKEFYEEFKYVFNTSISNNQFSVIQQNSGNYILCEKV